MTHEARANTLKITLDQLMQAESVCVGCAHSEGIEPMHAVCCRQGGSCATKKKVNWNGVCPETKWDNRPPRPARTTTPDATRSLQVRYLKQKRLGIRLGEAVMTQKEQREAMASLRAR